MRPIVFRLALALVLAAVGALPATARAADSASASVEAFFRHADYGSLKLSPSGRYLAARVPVGGRTRVIVIDLDTRTTEAAGVVEGRDIGDFHWVNDNRLVFSVMDLQSGLGEQRGGGLFAVNRDGSEFRELAPTARKQMMGMNMVPRFTSFHSALLDGSDDILVVANEANARLPDLYRVNTRTGRKTLKSYDKPGDVVGYVVDRKGVLRAAITDEKSIGSRVYWRADEDAKWELLGDFGLSGARFLPIAFDGDGSLIVASNIGRDTYAIYRYDTAKKALGEEIAAHPQADLVGGLVFDRRKNRIVGLVHDGMRPGAAWFDDDWARLQRTVDAALPDRMNVLTRGTTSTRVLVASYSDIDPGSFHVLDVDKKTLEFVGAQRKAIRADEMAARKPVRYAARDGLEIPAYLTLPKGREAKNLPLVVYVHGGPYMRGAHWAWSAEPEYLAALGYAVLEPEFRGSTGWGRKLFEAGWKQWGRGMQDDLDDGVDWLAKEGTIDPKRACIMGGSYGGYAVLMGMARNPERWRCGIDIVGVTDINLMFDVTWSDFAYSDFIRYAAKELIGDPDKDAAMLRAASPLVNAAKIKKPVLMAYGAQDFRVPIIHGEKMRDALEAQGTPVEWVVYPDEGHGFLLEANRFDFYRRVEKFLGENLRPN